MRRSLALSLSSIDRTLLLGAMALAAASAAIMVSAASTVNPQLALRHWSWMAAGFVLSLLISRTNYRRWIDAAWAAYAASLVLLALVEVAGAVRLGATRWLSVFGFSVQPSELAKLTTVWMLARYLGGQPQPLSNRAVLVSLVIAGLPAGLVLIQPDLGSASIFGAIWLGMVYTGGAPGRLLAWLLAGLAACLPVGWHFLHGYQKDRLLAFVNPHADPLGAGYTIIQSTIAIGSGRLFGKGWFGGTQNQLSFLPERHSDFIFSVIGEEWGFVGCVAIVGLFSWVLARLASIALSLSEPQGKLMAAGVFSWIGYQAFVNIGMVMGLLPVVGVPLPFVSYGGSSMVALWVAIGLIQSAWRVHRE